MRYIKRAIVTLLALLVIGAGVLYGLAQNRLSKGYELVRRSVELPTDSAAIARGEHLATAIGKCGECHGDDFGGKIVIDDPALGRFAGPNLTTGRGGVGGSRSDADLVTAIRHGVGKDGRTLVFMPSEDYTHFSEADLRDLLAYVRSRPPVDREVPARRLGPVGVMLVATDQFMVPAPRIDHGAIPVDSVVPAPTAEYGAYLAKVGGCTGCHNPSLSGGPAGGPPGTPPAANLTPGGRVWSLADFTVAMRDGIRPGGTKIDPFMPVQYTKLMTDQEIEAVWRYITSVPSKALGER